MTTLYELEMTMRSQSQLREIERIRSLREALAAHKKGYGFSDRLLSQLGGELVRFGRRLQNRHDLKQLSQSM